MNKILKIILILIGTVLAAFFALFLWFLIINWDEFEQESLGYPDDPLLHDSNK